MNDLDTALRSVAHALVQQAPPPPPFPGDVPATASPSGHGVRRFAAVAAVVIAIAGLAIASTSLGRDHSTSVKTSAGDRPPGDQPSPQSYSCGADPALRVTVPGAIAGPTVGAAPGSHPVDAGQRAVHWTRGDGIVELRWPARPPRVYSDGTTPISTLYVSEAISPGRAQIDVHPSQDAAAPTMFEPDVIVEAQEPVAAGSTASCNLLELTVVTVDGRWFGGLRATVADGARGAPFERVDLQPLVIERRAVDAAPDSAVRCQGSDRDGTPPNRTGGPDPSVAGPQPVDVLVRYLATTPGAPPSGYVEMTEPDGSVTYAVDPSGIGWTTLVFVARDGDSWYLEGWTSSGC